MYRADLREGANGSSVGGTVIGPLPEVYPKHRCCVSSAIIFIIEEVQEIALRKRIEWQPVMQRL